MYRTNKQQETKTPFHAILKTYQTIHFIQISVEVILTFIFNYSR